MVSESEYDQESHHTAQIEEHIQWQEREGLWALPNWQTVFTLVKINTSEIFTIKYGKSH